MILLADFHVDLTRWGDCLARLAVTLPVDSRFDLIRGGDVHERLCGEIIGVSSGDLKFGSDYLGKTTCWIL